MWSDGLEQPALGIAANPASPLRVIAGPGSGKTFTLMRRIARLLEEGAQPERVLVSTFTRTAAKDLERELAKLGTPGMDRVDAGTLHALSFRVLNTAAYFDTTGRRARPLLEFEERFLLEDLGSTSFGTYWDKRRRLRAFNAAWSRLNHEEPGWPQDETDRLFESRLDSWLRFHGAMLIGELIPKTLAFLRQNPLAQEVPAYTHVLVDEYQDLNRAEQALLDIISRNAMVTVVGDEDQSIYSFKHAHREGIADYGESHPGTADEHLIECRRCPSEIIYAVNALIGHNETRSNRVLVPRPGCPAGEIHSVQWPDMATEAEGLATFIKARVDSRSVSAGRILVLAPRREFGYAIRDALEELGIEAKSFFSEQELDGSPKDLAASKAQQAFTLLTLLATPNDPVALRAWAGFGSQSLREPAWARLRGYANEAALPIRAVLEQLLTGEVTVASSHNVRLRFAALKEEEAQRAGLRGEQLLDSLFAAAESWAEPFRTLAAPFLVEDPELGPAGLLQGLRQGITQPELPTEVDFVRVMSLHKSKGLTADLVVIAGCVQGLIPSSYSDRRTDLSAADFLQEQRRLLFVGMTRTTQCLVLSSTASLPFSYGMKWELPFSRRTNELMYTRSSDLLAECGNSVPPTMSGERWLPLVT